MNNNLDTRIQHAVIGDTNNAGKTTATDDKPLRGEIVFNNTLTNFRVGTDGNTAYSSLPDFLKIYTADPTYGATAGLVPGTATTSEISAGNYFLNANGSWTTVSSTDENVKQVNDNNTLLPVITSPVTTSGNVDYVKYNSETKIGQGLLQIQRGGYKLQLENNEYHPLLVYHLNGDTFDLIENKIVLTSGVVSAPSSQGQHLSYVYQDGGYGIKWKGSVETWTFTTSAGQTYTKNVVLE